MSASSLSKVRWQPGLLVGGTMTSVGEEQGLTLSARLVRRALRATTVGVACGPHLTRYSMYRELAAVVPSQLPPGPLQVLSVSGSGNLAALFAEEPEVVDAVYPEHDLRDLSAFKDDTFDAVVTDQVLEHIEGNPQRAIDESVRVLKPGGLVVHTTCFMNPVHRHPVDFWRFTPECLEWLLRDCEVVTTGGWGNRWAAALMDYGPRFVPVPHSRWHPLHWLATRHDPAWPIVTWVVARKRLDAA